MSIAKNQKNLKKNKNTNQIYCIYFIDFERFNFNFGRFNFIFEYLFVNAIIASNNLQIVKKRSLPDSVFVNYSKSG
jgi:hypothetical protein